MESIITRLRRPTLIGDVTLAQAIVAAEAYRGALELVFGSAVLVDLTPQDAAGITVYRAKFVIPQEFCTNIAEQIRRENQAIHSLTLTSPDLVGRIVVEYVSSLGRG